MQLNEISKQLGETPEQNVPKGLTNKYMTASKHGQRQSPVGIADTVDLFPLVGDQ